MNPVAAATPAPHQTYQVEEKSIEDKIKAIKNKSFTDWSGIDPSGGGSVSSLLLPGVLIGFGFIPGIVLRMFEGNPLGLALGLGIPGTLTLATFAVYSVLYVKFRSMQNKKIEELIETSKNEHKVEEDNNSNSITFTLSNSSTEDAIVVEKCT